MKNNKKKWKKKGKKAQNRALKFEKHTKCKKIFSKHFLLGFWIKTFLSSMKLIHFLRLVTLKFFQNKYWSEIETKDLFGCTKYKFLHNYTSWVTIWTFWNKMFLIFCCDINLKITFTLNLKYINLWDFISCQIRLYYWINSVASGGSI